MQTHLNAALARRFWIRIDIAGPDECWDFVGDLNPDGYGRFRVEASGNSRQAHRVAWELVFGPIPPGLIVRHLCGRARCCNPAHLRPGTHAENAADRVRHGRDFRGAKNPIFRHPEKIRRGTQIAHAVRLTEEAVREIRALYRRRAPGVPREAGSVALAKRYGVSHRTILRIVNRQAWSHVS